MQIYIQAHPIFRRDGNNIRSLLSVTAGEAMAGAKIQIETLSGPVQLTVPKSSNTGSILRLRGKGVPSKGGVGDHYVELQVILPDDPDGELIRYITEWEAKHPYDPRTKQEARS